MRFCITSLGCALILSAASIATAEIQTEEIRYTHNGTEMIGFLAYDDAVDGPRPGVLVLHEWWGLNDFAKKRATQLARMGYVAFAADLYGDGKSTEHPQEAGAMAGKVRENVENWRGRAAAALDILKKRPECDSERLAAIGYCFGGSTALQLAYSGADLDAVSTFHAALPIPTEEEVKAIKPDILINHGADDSFISPETIAEFKSVLGNSDVQWTFAEYAGAVHGFSVPGAEKKGLDGLAYNARADKQSWRAMRGLFQDKLSDKEGKKK